jgi:hypothetical protein
MIRDDGAYGDQGFKIPALRVLRQHFDQIWEISTGDFAQEAMENTGLVDGFIKIDENFYDWLQADQDDFLNDATGGIDFPVYLKTIGCIPGRLNFHMADKLSKKPVEWRRKRNVGLNYFDEMSRWLDVPEAVGIRPATNITQAEGQFLRSFRADYNIPTDAFLLGWQLTGSSGAKRTPQLPEVMKAIFNKYPFVHLVVTGDLGGDAPELNSDPRCTNMYGLLSFREAYLLTSIMNCFVTPNTGVFVFSQCFQKTPKILISNIIDGNHCVCGDDTTVIQSAAECSPCYLLTQECKMDGDNPWFHCAGKIRPDRIIKAIEKEIRVWQGLQ